MEEIDLKDLVRTFWSKKVYIILILILFIAIGFIYTFNFVEPKYSSNTTLILASINNKTTSTTSSEIDSTYDTATIDRDITINSKLVSTYSELIKSKNILRRVISNLDIDIDEDTLKKEITVDTVEDTGIIRITVEDASSELACYIANEIANVFKEQIKVYYDIENVQVVDIAEVETEPSNIHHKRDIAIFGLLGIVVSFGYVLIYNMLDTTVKSIEEVEEMTKLTVIATFPSIDSVEKMSTYGVKKKSGGK